VATADGSLAAHWEHTIAILDDGPWVLTAPDGGRAGLAARGVELSSAAGELPGKAGIAEQNHPIQPE
jgi:methionyl aminopeptidase